jgi:hypothetical protein
VRRVVAALLIVTTVSGCVSGRRVPPDYDLVPGSTVSIEFDRPQSLRARADSADYLIAEVRFMTGRLEAVTADTIALRVGEMTPATPSPRPIRVAIPRDIPMRIHLEPRAGEYRQSKSETGIQIMALAAGATAVVLFILAIKGLRNIFGDGPDALPSG